MRVELLYLAGCPAAAQLLPRLRELAAEAGAEVLLQAVETPQAAEHARFLGSPTVRIDGRDVDPDVGPRADYGLKCRLYRVGGRQLTAPPEAWIRAALAVEDS